VIVATRKPLPGIGLVAKLDEHRLGRAHMLLGHEEVDVCHTPQVEATVGNPRDERSSLERHQIDASVSTTLGELASSLEKRVRLLRPDQAREGEASRDLLGRAHAMPPDASEK